MNNRGLFNDSEADDCVRTQIKICGITSTRDAGYAVEHGADAIGLVFYAPSSRNLTPGQAKLIRESLPDSVSSVGVVVDPVDELLEQVINTVGVDFIQFHGNESPERCRESGIPYIKALRVQSTGQIQQALERYTDAAAFLLDAYESERVGGTGRTFAWDMIPRIETPVILAGGLSAENVCDAIRQVGPTGVDVSTGVEISGGVKDRNAIHQFVSAVRSADMLRH